MKRLALTFTALGLAAGLAACSKKPETLPAEAAAPAAGVTTSASGDMSKMDMAADAKSAKGTGTVTAVDTTAGTITIDHAPIPEANWPAMTMAFRATPELAKSVTPGDKVAFELQLQGGAAEVTAIQKQ
ncbi:copper-binding protein [Phenylobacterium sp. 58.2.17]|jgi:Cu(I)/Ag(I) efflux system periplasmic protein CusF|uniref:copper-binding protein n=1 Tax=Phenylobacterium sp. 58.2.17 TaxID=2969306 RepID=UPI002263D538|nr:copper-binding protein [Phenylobacterium sp. 58.2.17]MCX7586355.1 copper-binding protein [Phenylobacterium sp. 58.2.17]